MRLLVLNIGSSSFKFSLYDMDTSAREWRGQYELGSKKGPSLVMALGNGDKKAYTKSKVVTASDAFKELPVLMKELNLAAPDAVVHRVAHGGEFFRHPTLVDKEVLAKLDECTPLAPLHNPPAIDGIKFAQKTWKGLPQIAVFDTAFHQSIPQRAHTYAVPKEWREAGLRRYGFHGSSHKYVAYRAAEVLGVRLQNLNIISCHLGNGASVCAIERGKSVDTSMGMTALEGLVMGTRPGDLDPGALEFLQESLGLTREQLMEGLYKQSGLKGLSNGFSNDLRDIEQEAAAGDLACQLAINVYAYRVRKYIGSYAAAMGGVDVLAFTGGIGENSVAMRRRICDNLAFMDIRVDEMANQHINISDGKVAQIQMPNSMVRIMVLESREQWMIAQEGKELLDRMAVAEPESKVKIPVAISARHCHLDRRTVDTLFGKGYELTPFKHLTQPGNWASKETVDIVGPKGELKRMRILGPLRKFNQVEVSKTDTFILGVDAPVRPSGHIEDTPKIRIRGLLDEVETDGLIIAERHIHMSEKDAEKLGLEDGDYVDVRLNDETEFRNVLIRVSSEFVTEMHIDTDEGNAARLDPNTIAEIVGGVEVQSNTVADNVTVTNRRTRDKKHISPVKRGAAK